MRNSLKDQIKLCLKNSILNYFQRYSYTNSQPLDLLIPKERRIRSIVGGIETSMGTTVWEPIAKAIAKDNGFQVVEKNIQMPEPFPYELKVELDRTISLRESRITWISTHDCVEIYKKLSRIAKKKSVLYIDPPPGSGVDILLKKGGKEFAFDIKTVQPNVGDIKKFNRQILQWYMYRICLDPSVELDCKIAYPYNPYSNDFWSHTPHKNGILEPKIDAVVEDEFWNFLSGETNTYEQIRDIFIKLNREGFGKDISQMIDQLEN